MKKNKKKRPRQKVPAGKNNIAPAETRAGESLTLFWVVTVLTVLAANLVTVFAHFYVEANPDAEKMALLKGLLLFTGSLVGVVSLIVLPVLYRVRQVPPPLGLTAFGVCVATAPILTVIVQAFQ